MQKLAILNTAQIFPLMLKKKQFKNLKNSKNSNNLINRFCLIYNSYLIIIYNKYYRIIIYRYTRMNKRKNFLKF